MSEDPRTVHLSKEEREGLGQSGYDQQRNAASEGWPSSQSSVSIEMNTGGQKRLRCDYAIFGLDATRTSILLRRAFSVLAAEERRIYALTDAQAIAELDALKAKQDVQKIEKVEKTSVDSPS